MRSPNKVKMPFKYFKLEQKLINCLSGTPLTLPVGQTLTPFCDTAEFKFICLFNVIVTHNVA